MILFLFMMGVNFCVFAQSPLKGTWVLKEIKSQDMKKESISLLEKVSEELHYTCPVKITFAEEEFSCTLYYANEVEKKAAYYLIQGESSIYFSIQGEGAIPEKQFFLEWNQENGEDMQLRYSQETDSKDEIKYLYNYQKSK